VRIVKRLGREDLAARAGAAYRTMTHQARDRGVAVVALLLSSNLWMPPENQDRSEIESPEHFAAWIRWARGDLDGALAELRKPGAGAVRAFERATFLVQAGDWEGAHRDFVFARDHDPLGTRASTEINAAIAETASAEGAHVIDVEALFAPLADHGIPGWEVFADNCHPRPHALDLLARALMREVGAEACASRRWSGGDAPCPSQGCNIALPQDIGALAHPAAMGRDHPRRVFEGPFLALLRLAPADAPARIAQYADGELVRHDAPTRAAMLTAIGAAARNAGRHDLAREYLSRSLAVERTPAALVELALTVLRGGDEAAARTTLDEALLLDPTHVQARGLRTALEQ
jgi:tetratricopeptide (TPR) repeat protein